MSHRFAPVMRFAMALALASLVLSCAQGSTVGNDTLRLDPSDPAIRPARVVLISVAGLRPADYGVSAEADDGQLLGRATMPNLAAMASRGAYADAMAPVLPPSFYPAHASLVTGLQPNRHGVLGDELLGPEGLYLRGLSRENRIRGLPLWRAARASGRAVTALGWPSTGGADVELLWPDLGIPVLDEKAPWLDQLAREATPWIVDRLRRLDETVADVPWPPAPLRDSLIERLACEIADQPATPALWLLAFEQSGVALAGAGPGEDEARAALAAVDASIGRIVGCFREAGLLRETAFLVVGDRSFQPVHSYVFANVILERVGLITLAPVLHGSGIARWGAFVRSFGGSGLVYANDEAAALLAREALEEQADRTRAFRIVPAAELDGQHADPQAWFGVQGVPGYGIGKTARGLIIQAVQRRGLGGYLPSHPDSAVGFVAWGAGVRAGARVSRMSQVDVAPTVANLLRIDLPAADGSAVLGILQP